MTYTDAKRWLKTQLANDWTAEMATGFLAIEVGA